MYIYSVKQLKQIIMKMPDEMKIEEKNGSTLDMYNDRGSSRLCDVYIDRTVVFMQLDLNAVNGSLDIRFDEKVMKLSSYQVERLIEFLQQRD